MWTKAVVAAVSLLAAALGAEAQDSRLWRHNTTEDINFFLVTPVGNLVVGTKDGIEALDPETGEIRWSRNDVRDLPAAGFEVIPYTPFGVVRTSDAIEMISVVTGETLWDGTTLPLTKVRGYLTVPRHNLLLLYGQSTESKRSLVAVNPETGVEVWRQDALLERSSPALLKVDGIRSLSGHQPPLVDSDSTFILNLNKDGPMRIHARTGELIWRLDLGKSAPLPRKGYARMLYDGETLYVPYGRRLLALNTTDGAILWDRQDNFPSRVAQLELNDNGLVVRGTKPPEGKLTLVGGKLFIDVLDPATGVSEWESPFTDLDLATPLIALEEAILAVKRFELVALDYTDGTSNRVVEFELGGGEIPIAVETVGPDLLISSGHNFLSVTRQGFIAYHIYYEAPGLSFMEKAAILVASEGLLLMACEADDGCDTSEDWAIPFGEGEVGPYFRSMGTYLDALADRRVDRAEAANHAYTYTREPDASGRKGSSLVMLDKRTGWELGRVRIDERRPTYVLDNLSGRVFVKKNNRRIDAYEFPGR